jgi:hypothetical protein
VGGAGDAGRECALITVPPEELDGRIAAQQALIEEMREMGADLKQPADVCHSLVFASKDVALLAGERIGRFGFGVTVLDDDIGGEWFVFASQEQVLNARYLALVQAAMDRLAARFGGRYDDWDAGIHTDDWPDCGCAWPDAP